MKPTVSPTECVTTAFSAASTTVMTGQLRTERKHLEAERTIPPTVRVVRDVVML